MRYFSTALTNKSITCLDQKPQQSIQFKVAVACVILALDLSFLLVPRTVAHYCFLRKPPNISYFTFLKFSHSLYQERDFMLPSLESKLAFILS